MQEDVGREAQTQESILGAEGAELCLDASGLDSELFFLHRPFMLGPRKNYGKTKLTPRCRTRGFLDENTKVIIVLREIGRAHV